MMHSVQMRQDGPWWKILIDGKEVDGVTAVSMTVRAGEVPVFRFEVPASGVEIEAGNAKVEPARNELEKRVISNFRFMAARILDKDTDEVTMEDIAEVYKSRRFEGMRYVGPKKLSDLRTVLRREGLIE